MMPTRTTGEWWEQLREIASLKGYTHNGPCTRLAERANAYGGEEIRANNLYTFVKGSHPQGRGMSDEKLERVAWALGHRLELVPDDAVMVSRQTLVDLKNKAAEMQSTIGTLVKG